MRRLTITLFLAVVLAGCTTDPAAQAWQNAKTFADQMNQAEYLRALELVAPGSAAERYLTHMIAMDGAAGAAGYGKLTPPSELTVDDAAKTITLTAEGGASAIWRSFSHDDAGLVTGWALGTEGTPLADQLWTTPAEATTDTAKVTLVSAYRNDAGLWIALDLTASETDLAPDCKARYESEGQRFEAANCLGTPVVRQGETSPVTFRFEGADFGGTFELPLTTSGGDPIESVTVPVN